MKKIIEFCKENNFDFELETLSNGVSRAIIEAKDSLSAKEIIDKAESNGFRTMVTVYGRNTVAIYTPEGWKEHMKMFEIDIKEKRYKNERISKVLQRKQL